MHDKAAPIHARLIPAEEWGPGLAVWNGIAEWFGQRGPDGTTPLVRIASHVVIALVTVLVLFASRLHLPNWELREAPASTTAEELADGERQPANAAALRNDSLTRAAVPFTLIPERPRLDIMEHTVAAGDTLYGIADKYHISADTLVWANNLQDNPDLLRLGQVLEILPVDGVLYTVVKGDTVDSIAKKYHAQAADILSYEWNKLGPQQGTLTAGQKIIVPGGVIPAPARPAVAAYAAAQSAAAPANAPRGGGRFIWPTAGSISQGYGTYHRALDIASYIGAPVKAADAGYIAVAGWSNDGYGNHIIVDHGNGYQTLYAHLSKISVKPGQTVDKGQVIGLVGTTGNSTGPHLHFEVRQGGVGRNPFNFLP